MIAYTLYYQAHLRRAYQVWTPDILHMTEHWLSLWLQSGLEMDKAVVAATTSSMAIIGLVEEEFVFGELRVRGMRRWRGCQTRGWCSIASTIARRSSSWWSGP